MTNEEINIAVARKLGWKECGCAPEHRAAHKAYMPSKHTMPSYSTSIEAAWAIAEKRQMVLTHLRIVPSDREAFWRWKVEIQIGPAHLEDAFVYAEADTAALAICEAFLKVP